MAVGDGNGWVRCALGHTHWGVHGAAGLLLLSAGPRPHVLMQLRAGWTHEGGSWGLVGGARDSHEDVASAALREAAEEAGVEASAVRVVGDQVGVDHGNWRYTYVLGLATGDLSPRPLTAESDEIRWVPLEDVPEMRLHAGLGSAWESLAPGIASALSTVPPA